MATVWSILATLTMIAWAGSFLLMMYPVGSGRGILRNGATVSMIGFGLLTLFALRLAHGMP